MFTIKHKLADGTVRVSSCDRYDRNGTRITAFGRRGGEQFSDTIEAREGEAIFVENERGNTTDTIRGTKRAAA